MYLDYNASTPIDKRVLSYMTEVYLNNYGNADSRTHSYGTSAREVIEKARASVSDLLGISSNEVFFTSGATESNNIVLLGIIDYAERNNKKHIITTSIEHKSVLNPIEKLKDHGFEISYIKPGINGAVKIEDVIQAIREDTVLVSVMHANNETGIIQPVKEIGDILYRNHILFHVDAAQSFGKLVEELKTIKYSFLSASAHKMYGPQGIGTLVLKRERYKLPPIKPIMFGGSQEGGVRPGTLPTALIAGMGEACRIAKMEHKRNLESYKKIKKTIINMLECSQVMYSINGDLNVSMPNTINVCFKGVNSEALMISSRQFCGISNGSACNSSNYSPSYVLESMGIDPNDVKNSVRISWGLSGFDEDSFSKLLSIVKEFQ